MARSSIPVARVEPWQVFACLKFLEVASVLLRHAEGGVRGTDEAEASFCLRADGTASPVGVVCEFRVRARREQLTLEVYAHPPQRLEVGRSPNYRINFTPARTVCSPWR
jgi:CRISPR-associated protein Csx14